jgi:hypothetical protein
MFVLSAPEAADPTAVHYSSARIERVQVLLNVAVLLLTANALFVV